jgi:3-hydroxyacyl-[acyl-carrier-protein] dehydratase
MPPQLLYDITGIDLSSVLFDQEAIRQLNPQRGEMEHLNAIVYAEPQKGHIPGRPLLPGVIMIEAGAQLASFYTRKFSGWTGFIGFSGADSIRFRLPVPPGNRLYLLGHKDWERHGRFCCRVQGLLNGSIAFEASIIGAVL